MRDDPTDDDSTRPPPGGLRLNDGSVAGCASVTLLLLALLLGVAVSTHRAAVDSNVQAFGTAFSSIDSANSSGVPGFMDSRQAPLQKVVRVYVYNTTNPDEVVAGGVPILRTIGPLFFNSITTREEVAWVHGTTVTYVERTWFEVSPREPISMCNASARATPTPVGVLGRLGRLMRAVGASAPTPSRTPCASPVPDPIPNTQHLLNEHVFSPYTPLLLVFNNNLEPNLLAAALAKAKVMATLPGASNNYSLFTRTSIQDLLFGRPDELYDFLHDLYPTAIPGAFPGLLQNGSILYSLSGGMGGGGPSSQKLCPQPGVTCSDSRTQVAWDDMNSVTCCLAGPCGSIGNAGAERSRPAWGTELANIVAGASSSQAPPGLLSPGEQLAVFRPDLARTVQYVADGAPTDVNGIPGLQLTITPETLLPSAQYPPNAAYFADSKLTGLLNVTNCAGAQPFFVSKPAFLDADESLWKAVHGLPPPSAEQHDTIMVVEPASGLVTRLSERVQVNIFLDPMASVDGTAPPLFPDIVPVYLPLFWTDTEGTLTPAAADELYAGVVAPRVALSDAVTAIITIASVLGFASVGLGLLAWRQTFTEKRTRLAAVGHLLAVRIKDRAVREALARAGRDDEVLSPYEPLMA